MLISDLYLTVPKASLEKPLIEVIDEFCKEVEPKPLYCEWPDELKLKSIDASGTVQTYTYTSSLGSASGYGTSTTTTI